MIFFHNLDNVLSSSIDSGYSATGYASSLVSTIADMNKRVRDIA